MKENTKSILKSELSSAHGYLERIIHVLSEITQLISTPESKEILRDLHKETVSLLQEDLLKNLLLEVDPTFLNPRDTRETIKSVVQLLESVLSLGIKEEIGIKVVVEFINLLYKHAHSLHIFSLRTNTLEITYPRMTLITTDDEWDSYTIPKFYLPIDMVYQLHEKDMGFIGTLQWQRDNKYRDLIEKGHRFIFEKNYPKSLEHFERACNYNESAEVLTLIAWVYFLLNKTEKAKSFCLKAIRKDADYGPPYNDLGNYILAEGQVEESLKWFSLAKKSINYQNREYPYINSGRAFMMKEEYAKALDEFSIALTLAPYHNELHETVRRLKEAMDNEIETLDTISEQ
ncbi:MAG: hypothetical protein ISR65_00385 [Bacteriovoracaceae bacterium]|nr:hypothetical protein [Bacteriovoracaceae bacterium]